MDYFTLRRREFDTTLRVLQSFPEDQLHLKPAAKSRTAAQLALVLALEERVISSLIQNGVADPSVWAVELPSSMAKIIEMWQAAVATNNDLIAKLPSEPWNHIVNFYGRHISLSEALWLELLDHIHHRGQFSVYLRLAGARVPSIYGPTADESFVAAQ